MIPVGPGEIPVTASELESRIAAALDQVLSKGQRPTVRAAMATPGVIDSLTVNLTGAEVGDARMEKPRGFTTLGPVVAHSFQISGDPALAFGAPLRVNTSAQNLPMAWTRDDHGRLWLVPAQSAEGGAAPSGNLEIAARTSDIENAARAAVAAVAEKNGAKLKGLNLTIETAGPRSLAAKIDVAASKFMMTAKLAIIAEAALDDAMNLRVTRMDVKGDGAAGSMIAKMLEDKLGDIQGRQIPLGQFAFAGSTVKDVTITGGNEITLKATFA